MSTGTPKPCGICGREPKVGIVISSGWIVACESCGVHGWPEESAEKAIATWNDRPAQRAWIERQS